MDYRMVKPYKGAKFPPWTGCVEGVKTLATSQSDMLHFVTAVVMCVRPWCCLFQKMCTDILVIDVDHSFVAVLFTKLLLWKYDPYMWPLIGVIEKAVKFIHSTVRSDVHIYICAMYQLPCQTVDFDLPCVETLQSALCCCVSITNLL